jgi:transcriptional antiterminator RfaH
MISQDNEKQWFAVRTKPRQEHVAGMHYKRQGFYYYLPLIQGIRRHARRTEKVIRPLFPGYLFLHLAPSERRWETISSTIGSVGAVRLGNCFPTVPDWVITEIQRRENSKGYIPLSAVGNAALMPGDRLEFLMGEHETAEGIFLKFRSRDRIVLLMELLNRQLPVEISLSRLKSMHEQM